MNDRLLKESDVLRAVDKRIEELSKDPVFIQKNGQIDLYGIKKYLLAVPTAEWPQGEWETVGKTHPYKRCPFCKRVRAFTDTRFCDWCGARMKGADDGSR